METLKGVRSSRGPPGAGEGSLGLACRGGVSAGIDWLGGTFSKEVTAGELVEKLIKVGGNQFERAFWEKLDCRRHDWSTVWRGPGGAELWTGCPVRGPHLELPGQACEMLGSAGLRSIANAMHHASRVDVRLDDGARRVTPMDIWDLVNHRHADREPGGKAAGVVTRSRGTPVLHLSEGETVYVGSPKSDRRLRVYDKSVESDGRIDAIRWELQTRRDAAEALRRALCSGGNDREIVNVICGTLRGFIDFRRPGRVRDNVERWKRESWWEELTGGAEVVRMSVPDGRSGEEKRAARAKWRREVMPTVVAALDAEGTTVGDAGREARSRFKPRHRRIAVGQVA